MNNEHKALMKNGMWENNPALVQLLGLCPLLAVSSTVTNALGLGIATLLVLVGSNVTVSLVRDYVPKEVRIPVFVMIIASLVTCVQLLMNAYAYGLYLSLGIFIPLIVTNCIIIGRCSNLILRNAGIPSLDIFLHADVNLRTEHIQKLGLNGKEDPRKYLTKMDNLRETYFKTYTKHELGTYHDYDLCLDTGTLGYDNCIEIITSLAKQQGLNLKHQ